MLTHTMYHWWPCQSSHVIHKKSKAIPRSMLVIELGREDVAADLAVELPVVALPLPDEVPLPGLITL